MSRDIKFSVYSNVDDEFLGTIWASGYADAKDRAIAKFGKNIYLEED